jgi:hypothetical protein
LTENEAASESEAEADYLRDIDHIYSHSFQKLAKEFREDFKLSSYYREMVLLLN